MKLSMLYEARRTIRLFAGLRSIKHIDSVLDHGILPNPHVGGAYFADTIKGAYDYRLSNNEDEYAVVEIIISPGHYGLIDRTLNLSDYEKVNIPKPLKQQIERALVASQRDKDFNAFYKSYVGDPYWRNPSLPLPKSSDDRLAAQYTRALKATSGDMSISHKIGFKGRPRIVAIYLIGTVGGKQQPYADNVITRKIYDRGEASHNVGHKIRKLSKLETKQIIAKKYLAHIQDDILYIGSASFTVNKGMIVARAGTNIATYPLTSDGFVQALMDYTP